MKISEIYSHLNGKEYILVHKKELWDELKEVISLVKYKTKVSKDKTRKREILYDQKEINKEFKKLFNKRQWKESRVNYWVTKSEELIRKTLTMPTNEQKKEIESSGETPIKSYNQTDFIKDRIAVEVQFGKYSFVAYDLFVKHLSFYVSDKINVGIEILPMKSLQKNMSSGPSYYERELYNMVRQRRGVPAVPIVLIGIEI